MSLNHVIFEVNYNLMFETLHPLELECVGEQDSIIRCKLTWLEVKARPGLLDRLSRHTRDIGKIIWFQTGDPYKGSKPFEITWIGLDNMGEVKSDPTIILIAAGQKSERIKKKWIGKLTPFFGYPVEIMWEENTQ